MKKITIAVDGYSSCGKSTLAKQLAKHLSYIFIDTGAMYRAVTFYCLNNDIINNEKVDEKKLKDSIPKINISFKINSDTNNKDIYLNGENIEIEIRKLYISENVSSVSKIKFVREFLVSIQQKMGEEKGVVMDGRDIGTVVFPNAELKIFMTADKDIRATRRFNELKEKNIPEDFNAIKDNLLKRDYEDENRAESPLKQASDAIVLDNSEMSVEQQLNVAIKWVDDILNPEEKSKKFTLQKCFSCKIFLIALVLLIIMFFFTAVQFC